MEVTLWISKAKSQKVRKISGVTIYETLSAGSANGLQPTQLWASPNSLTWRSLASFVATHEVAATPKAEAGRINPRLLCAQTKMKSKKSFYTVRFGARHCFDLWGSIVLLTDWFLAQPFLHTPGPPAQGWAEASHTNHLSRKHPTGLATFQTGQGWCWGWGGGGIFFNSGSSQMILVCDKLTWNLLTSVSEETKAQVFQKKDDLTAQGSQMQHFILHQKTKMLYYSILKFPNFMALLELCIVLNMTNKYKNV